MDNLNIRSVIRVLAGAYVIYLGINILQGVLQGAAEPWLAIFSVLFFVVGGVLIVFFLRDLIRGQKQRQEEYMEKLREKKEKMQQQQEQSQLGQVRSMTDITRYTSVSEEDQEAE